MVTHITWTVKHLEKELTVVFFELFGFWPIPVEDTAVERAANQVWFTNGGECDVHIVEHEFARPKVWDHICVNSLTPAQVQRCASSYWVERNRLDSRRLWLRGPGGIRIEIRKASRALLD